MWERNVLRPQPSVGKGNEGHACRAWSPVFALRATTRRESIGAAKAWRRRPAPAEISIRIRRDRETPPYIQDTPAPTPENISRTAARFRNEESADLHAM